MYAIMQGTSHPPHIRQHATTYASSSSHLSMATTSIVSTSSTSDSQPQDVDMTTISEGSSSRSGATTSSESSQRTVSSLQTPSTRRARVEDDHQEEDYFRESNRQRMNSPTLRDNQQHHFMPIPEDHGVPHFTAERTRREARAPPPQQQEQPNNGPAPPPGFGRMVWSLLPPIRNGQPNAQPAGGQPDHRHGHPMMNLFVNIPLTGHGAGPQPDQVPNSANGNARPIYIILHYTYHIHSGRRSSSW